MERMPENEAIAKMEDARRCRDVRSSRTCWTYREREGTIFNQVGEMFIIPAIIMTGLFVYMILYEI